MLTKEWLSMFLERHKVRNPRNDWHAPDSDAGREMWRGYLDGFIGAKVKKSEADAASVRIADGDDPPRFVEDHLPALLAQIEWNRGVLAATREAPTVVTEKPATPTAVDCPHCRGHGLVTVFHPGYGGLPIVDVVGAGGEVRQIPGRVSAHCVCPVGRWMRARTEEATLPRIPDLAPVVEGRSRWTMHDPTTPDLPEGCSEGMTFTEFWGVIQRPGVGPTRVEPVPTPDRIREPGDDDE